MNADGGHAAWKPSVKNLLSVAPHPMLITDIRATTVTVPVEAPLRHSNGAHWGRFVRTVVEIDTDEGITGLGEMGGGGESAALAFSGLKTYLVGHDPFDLNRMRYAICNPTAMQSSAAWSRSSKVSRANSKARRRADSWGSPNCHPMSLRGVVFSVMTAPRFLAFYPLDRVGKKASRKDSGHFSFALLAIHAFVE